MTKQYNNEKISENIKNKRDWDVINMEEPRKQSVSYRGVPCTARTCVTNLNRLTEENQTLKEENEQLKQAYTRLEHRHSLLHDVCIDAECDRDSYCKDVASLEKENEQLKRKVDFYKYFQKDARELDKENEQLKQFKEDVFTKIDMHLRMLPIFRNNEFNEEYGDPSFYTGAIGILKTLKRELKE